MYINNAYVKDSLLNYKDIKNPLSIVSCGTYRLLSVKELPTLRPRGRLDYQLIYIASGIGHFYFRKNEDETIIPAGTFVLFRPREYQKYIYYGSEHTEVFWIHFSGTNVKNYLRKIGITDDMHIIKTGTSMIYPEIFTNIVNEIQQKNTGYEQMIEAYFKQLLILISRNHALECDVTNSFIRHEVELAKQYFSEHYSEEINIENYSFSRGMSISWFIRNFKKVTNTTPLQYILLQRIANAQILLESTDYSIGEISRIVGYENQLYFSRLFTKQKGMSPKRYRELIMGT